MKKLVEDFPSHLREAVREADKHKTPRLASPEMMVVAGMGGSGIAAKIVFDILQDEILVPCFVYSGYSFPSFLNKKSRVVLSSYSGNTEETLKFYDRIKEKNISYAAVTSGGKLLELAKKDKAELALLPAGFPPRACLGYSMVRLLGMLAGYKLCDWSHLKKIESAARFLELEQDDIRDKAYKMARRLFRKIPVIYALGKTEGIAIRLRQQINENAKMLCWHHVFPEMNHNELVGWKMKNEEVGVIALRSNYDYPGNLKRWEYCKPIFIQQCREVNEIQARGNNLWEEMLYLIHFSDWLSCFLADLRKVDATEVDVIDGLKKFLENK
ncbi:MAG: bifunctional phosphoglucose/phosphomannose isomerase [Bacteroidia bacterium]|nr:bifunctional phosphoglucose/phosphomannose isomerase [Bacteroidia bacterium]